KEDMGWTRGTAPPPTRRRTTSSGSSILADEDRAPDVVDQADLFGSRDPSYPRRRPGACRGVPRPRDMEERFFEHRIGREVGMREMYAPCRIGQCTQRDAAAHAGRRNAHRVAVAHEIDPLQLC